MGLEPLGLDKMVTEMSFSFFIKSLSVKTFYFDYIEKNGYYILQHFFFCDDNLKKF